MGKWETIYNREELGDEYMTESGLLIFLVALLFIVIIVLGVVYGFNLNIFDYV